MSSPSQTEREQRTTHWETCTPRGQGSICTRAGHGRGTKKIAHPKLRSLDQRCGALGGSKSLALRWDIRHSCKRGARNDCEASRSCGRRMLLQCAGPRGLPPPPDSASRHISSNTRPGTTKERERPWQRSCMVFQETGPSSTWHITLRRFQ